MVQQLIGPEGAVVRPSVLVGQPSVEHFVLVSGVPRSTPRVDWHVDQFDRPKRATLAFSVFIERLLDVEPTSVLDAGCGSGANIAHLMGLAPSASWAGIDRDAHALSLGRRRLPESVTLCEGDLEDLTSVEDNRFDVTLSSMVLSWLPSYEQALAESVRVTRSWIFISSLFWAGDYDAYTRVRGADLDAHYNVYSLSRFRTVASSLGTREVIAEPFEIDIDLARPDHGGMQTWTERLTNGRRLQLSGPLLMPWWFVAVRL